MMLNILMRVSCVHVHEVHESTLFPRKWDKNDLLVQKKSIFQRNK